MGGLTAVSGCWAVWALSDPHSRREKKGENVSLWDVSFRLLRNSGSRMLILAGMLAKAGVFGLVVVFAPLVQELSDSPDYAATWVGLLQALTWGMTMFGGFWWGRRNDRSSLEKNFFLASMICGLSICLQMGMDHLYWLIPLRMVQGFCFGALLPAVFMKVSQSSGEEVRGASIGVTNSFLVLGQVIGSFSTAWISSWLSAEFAFVFIGGLFMVAALLMLPLVRPYRSDFFRLFRLKTRQGSVQQVNDQL